MYPLKRLFFATLLLACALTAPCSAQSWIQVKGGAFAIPPTVLAEMKATLREHVYKEVQPTTRWSDYLLQFQAVRVAGVRELEIHGSCYVDKEAERQLDIHSEFFDNYIMDGGECFFVVFYNPDSKRYSNPVFHGRA